ncbi:after-VIT domain-containing protein [Microcoleus sp. LEGE 07076]|uniref:VIT domain-containing protein n=1 Tax=Microcoleus sp. LEGE 07076 TaxID=915322 RepID=UPI00187F46E2|nr:VIT domain-containing protein [Microcoleus sp. LEGE 07076]MBE9187037.1 after-VIT domain-containing protein [Microcoleus sp. LEGE 07076]
MKFVCVLSPQRLFSAGIALLAAILFEGFANECGVWLAPNGAQANALGPNYSSVPPKILASNDVSCNGARSPETRCQVGGLFVKTQNTAREQVFPLKKTEVKAKIAGNISRVEVVQKFENPFPESLEAVYVFPLPDEAAVDDMEIKIGNRTIKGDIKRRDEALEIYQKAREQGRTAGLLEQERSNIFTQSLVNIKPGEKIEVTIRYTESLKFVGGDYEFVFPTVVGPRYISRNTTDADRINPPVLPPGTRSGHDIAVEVEIDAGVAIGNIVRSTSHQITTQRSGNIVRVQLADSDTIPNKDLILRYRVAGENTQATVLTQSDQRGGHFATYLIPALKYKANEIVPKDVVFLMDTSGSQQGEPLAKSKELMRRFIQGLNPKDSFSIIDFANTAKALSTTPLANTAANRQSAIDYIDKLQANGGTELLNGIQTVMNFPATETGRLRSIVLITDGYIGNEKEVLAGVQESLKPGNRLYSFGVGSSVNRFLIARLAEVGRGTSQVIRQDEPSAEAAEKFFRQINNPVLTNIQISWAGMGEKPEIYPIAPPDLFTSQPLVLFGKKTDRTNGQLRIRGTQAGGKVYEQILPVNFTQSGRQRESTSVAASVTDFGNPAVAQLWGRSRIKNLMNQMFGGETESLVEAVTNTALTYRLLSEYTAFVAVSEEVRVEPDGSRRRVQVPVELPQGVNYEGIFDSEKDEQTRGGVRSITPTRAFSPIAPAPGVAQRARYSEPAPPPPPPKPLASRLQVVSAQGLDAGSRAALTQYLQSVNLPAGVSGETVWELSVQNGHVQKVAIVFDGFANDSGSSTLQATEALETLKKALISWQPPAGFQGRVRLILRINADR